MVIGCLGVDRRAERFFSYLAIFAKKPLKQLHVRARLRRVARIAGNQILSPPHLYEPDLP